jgi:hypothetical protein
MLIAFRLSQCPWLSASQRHNVESCIRTLSDMARSRSIAIPSDLDNQVTSLFNKPALHLGASKASKIFRSSRLQSAQLSRESSQSQLSVRFDRTIIEGLQDIVVLLEAQLHPLVQAESSVIVDVLYRPEYLFQPGTEARKKCDNGGFIRRLIKHTERLLEIKRKNFASRSSTRCARCDVHNGEKVFQVIFKVNELHKLTYYFPQKQGDTLRKNLLGALFCQTGLS